MRGSGAYHPLPTPCSPPPSRSTSLSDCVCTTFFPSITFLASSIHFADASSASTSLVSDLYVSPRFILATCSDPPPWFCNSWGRRSGGPSGRGLLGESATGSAYSLIPTLCSPPPLRSTSLSDLICTIFSPLHAGDALHPADASSASTSLVSDLYVSPRLILTTPSSTPAGFCICWGRRSGGPGRELGESVMAGACIYCHSSPSQGAGSTRGK